MKKAVVIEAISGCFADLGDGREHFVRGQRFRLSNRELFEKAVKSLGPSSFRELTAEEIEAAGAAVDTYPKRPSKPDTSIPEKPKRGTKRKTRDEGQSETVPDKPGGG